MTRVLHVTECYAGGVSRAIEAAVAHTPQHEHHLLWTGDEPPTNRDMYASVRELPKRLISRIRAVKSAVRDLEPDVVHAHSSWAGVYSRALNVKAPVVYQPHGYKFEDLLSPAPARMAYRVAEKALMRRTARVAVLSPRENELAAELSTKVPRTLVPNVASLIPSAMVERSATPTKVVMIGRVSRQKDPDYFLEVAQKVHRSRPGIEFIWAGQGDEPTERELATGGVTVTGWLDAHDLGELLSEPIIYFHSAAYEGFPLSILDAASFNVPIIARAIPALRGTSIHQVQSTDEAAADIVKAIEDPSFRQQLELESEKILTTMNPLAQGEALSGLYEIFSSKDGIA